MEDQYLLTAATSSRFAGCRDRAMPDHRHKIHALVQEL
jgi:hypothetical protein